VVNTGAWTLVIEVLYLMVHPLKQEVTGAHGDTVRIVVK
jgi:hypothetical protein